MSASGEITPLAVCIREGLVADANRTPEKSAMRWWLAQCGPSPSWGLTVMLTSMDAVISALRDSVAAGDAALAHKLVEDAVSSGADRQELLAGLSKMMP